jgi:hypothetical protein
VAGNLAHGLVEGQAEHPHKEINGVAFQISLRPAPVAVFDEQTWVIGQFEVAGGRLDQFQPALSTIWTLHPVAPSPLPPNPSTCHSHFCGPFGAKSTSFHKNPKSINQLLSSYRDSVCILLYSLDWYLALGRRSQRSSRYCRAPYRHQHLKKMTVRFRGHPGQPGQRQQTLSCPALPRITRTRTAPVHAPGHAFLNLSK